MDVNVVRVWVRIPAGRRTEEPSSWAAPRRRSRSRSCTASRSTWGPCHRGSTAPGSSPPRRSRTGNCWVRRRSSWWMWWVCRWPSRRSCPRRPGPCRKSRNVRGPGLEMKWNWLNYRALEGVKLSLPKLPDTANQNIFAVTKLWYLTAEQLHSYCHRLLDMQQLKSVENPINMTTESTS